MHRRGPVLSVDGVGCARRRPIDLEVRAGEIVGLAGLEGHGGNTFLEALRGGIATAAGDVVRHEDGRDVVIRTPADAADHGVAYVPRDRARGIPCSADPSARTSRMPTSAGTGGAACSSSERHVAGLRQYVDRLEIVLGSPDESRSRRCPAATSRRW